MDDTKPRKHKNTKRDSWPVTAFFLTFGLALVFSLISETTIIGIPVFVAVLVLFLIVSIGIGADIVGVAITSETVTAFSAMASKKIRGAKQAINLVQNAHRVSNICNDVIGDICGIVSGAMCVAIVERLLTSPEGMGAVIVNVIAAALLSAITVTGKAFGKRIALNYSTQIVFTVARFLAVFEKRKKTAGE